MLVIENIRLALTSIRVNKMRSFLTMLGIIIGISSVIAITSIGASAKAVVSKEFESFGMNAMFVYTNWEMTSDYLEYSDLLYPEDLEALQKRFHDDILYLAPNVSANSDTKVGRLTGELAMTGIAADYNNFSKMNILYGRMINQNDLDGARDRIVIEKKTAKHFFNKDNAVGKVLRVTINGEIRDLTIVGIYEVPASIFAGLDTSKSYKAFVPYTLLEAGDKSTSMFEIYTSTNKEPSVVGEQITNYLCTIKDKEPNFYVFQSAEAQMSQINNILGILSIAIGAIAAISLLVGGIGIMNIMLVSVTERTREIGIRKSLGARTNDILMQFLIESMIISAIGGVIGTMLGTAIAAIGMGIAGIAVIIEPAVIIMAVSFSALVGIFFGLYPARKAARLDPIEALRYE